MGLRRHTNLASYALGSVVKYRSRSTIIVLGLIVSVTLLCSVEFIRDGVVLDLSASLEEGPDIIIQRLEAGRQALVPLSWKNTVSSIEEVRVSTPRVWGYMDAGNGKLLTVMGVNVTEYSDIFGAVGTAILSTGRFLDANMTGELVIGQGIIDLMNSAASPVTIGVGSEIQLIDHQGGLVPFEIVGVFSTESKIHSYDMVLTDIVSARGLFGVNASACTDLAVWVDAGSNTDSVAFIIDSSLPQSRVLTQEGIRSASLRSYESQAGLVGLLWTVILMSVVLLAFAASSAGSDEARREVGLLKALGYDTVDVLEIRTIESLMLGFIGANIGISTAIVFDFVLGAPLLANYLLGWDLVLLNGGLPLVISVEAVFGAYFVSVIPILVATVIPAWRNAITEPDSVLRGL